MKVKRMRLKLNLFPRETKFFKLLREASANLLATAGVFQTLSENIVRCQEIALEINRLEHEGDRITNETVRLLYSSLVTPIDREDIHDLIQAIDDVVDITEGVIEQMMLYKIEHSRPELPAVANELLEACRAIDGAVQLLDKPHRYDEMRQFWDRIVQAEKRADRVYRHAIADLFNGTEADVLDIIKWREVFTHLENAVDATEQVCDVLQAIVLKSG